MDDPMTRSCYLDACRASPCGQSINSCDGVKGLGLGFRSEKVEDETS